MKSNLNRRRFMDKLFKYIFMFSIVICISFLVILLGSILVKGISHLSLNFLTNMPSRRPSKAGFKAALIGSLFLIFLVTIILVPIGVGTALYLEEYANKKSKLYNLLEVNISNLAGVPAIVYGILGLSIFGIISNIFSIELRGTLISGSIVLALLILPVVIVSSREAVKAVPNSLREAAYGLGMTKWQMIRATVLPYSTPGIMTGIVLSLSRALGEAAPLIVLGAATYVSKLPLNNYGAPDLMASYSAMPIQIFHWASDPKEQFKELASTGIIVLLIVLLSSNAVAIAVRNKYSKSKI